jgi:hypothetical protein
MAPPFGAAGPWVVAVSGTGRLLGGPGGGRWRTRLCPGDVLWAWRHAVLGRSWQVAGRPDRPRRGQPNSVTLRSVLIAMSDRVGSRTPGPRRRAVQGQIRCWRAGASQGDAGRRAWSTSRRQLRARLRTMSWLMTFTGAYPVARRSSRRGADPPRAPGRQPPPARLSDTIPTIPAVPGAIGTFRREALAAAGGLDDQFQGV